MQSLSHAGWLMAAARVLLGLLFVWSGAMKFMGGVSNFADGAIAGMGLPLPLLIAWIVVAIELVGGLMLIAGFYTRAAAAAIAVFAFLTVVLVHSDFRNDISFFKNLSILGGMLYVISCGPGTWSVDERRRSAPAAA